MARPLRIEYPGALYHVTSRGNAKADIYLSKLDKKKFLEIFAEVCKKYNWYCYAYCLMNNHYHLLIETPLANLSAGMRQLNGVYTLVFNKMNQRVGHLFQGRYKAILVDKDTYLLELSRYIVLNPVRAKLVPEVHNWTWSSYLETAGLLTKNNWLRTDLLLGYFNKNHYLAKESYRKFVEDGLVSKNPMDNLSQQIYLGSEEFVYEAQKKISGYKNFAEIPKIQIKNPAKFKTLQEYDKFYKNKLDAIFLAYESGIFSIKEIGDFFKMHYSTVSKKVSKYRTELMVKDQMPNSRPDPNR